MTPEELEKLNKENSQALKEMRETVGLIEKGVGGVAEMKEKVDKQNAALDKIEENNQAMVLKNAEALKAADKAAERIDKMEAKIIKLASTENISHSDAAKELEHLEKRAMDIFATRSLPGADASGGGKVMTNDEAALVKKYMNTVDNASGGFLVENAFDNSILKPINELDPIKAISSNRRIDAVGLTMAMQASEVTVSWTGEGKDFVDSEPGYSSPEIPVHSVTVKTPITNKLLLSSRFSMDNEILSNFSRALAKNLGNKFVSGDGSHKPRGFLATSAATPVKNAAGSSTIVFGDLIDLSGALKVGYNGTYAFNRKTLTHIRKMQDGAGGYVFTNGDIKAGIPNQVAGDPYVLSPSMPDIATNATPVAYADWMQFYMTVDAWTAIMLRNPYKLDGKIVFSMESFFGGDVIMKEAGVLLKTIA